MTRASDAGARDPAADPQELRVELEHAREELADTVSQLAGKADIASRARERTSRLRTQARHKADATKGRLRTDGGETSEGGRSSPNGTVVAAVAAGAVALAVALGVVYQRRCRR